MLRAFALQYTPLGELAANVVSRLRGYSRSAANAVCRYDPTCEKGIQKSPQAFLNPE